MPIRILRERREIAIREKVDDVGSKAGHESKRWFGIRSAIGLGAAEKSQDLFLMSAIRTDELRRPGRTCHWKKAVVEEHHEESLVRLQLRDRSGEFCTHRLELIPHHAARAVDDEPD